VADGVTEDTALPASRVTFVHNSEQQLARLLDFYSVRWEYEPHTFVLATDARGTTTEAFTPDFWLPDHEIYLEVTTMRQGLVTRKNRKVRHLRELHPEIRIRVVYQRDYLHLLVRFGLESPSQLDGLVSGVVAEDRAPSLLDASPTRRLHPSMPEFGVLLRAG
jgi:hypothetical protein